MPDVILPATFLSLLVEFRPVFTGRSFRNFVVLVCGAVHALGKRRVTDLIRGAGSAAVGHYSRYFRFFSRARWSVDELGLRLLGLVIWLFRLSEVVLVLDDTLVRRSGKKVALTSAHADALVTNRGRPFTAHGHVFVVLAVHVLRPALARTGWALPFMFRLFVGSCSGGRDDAPSDSRRARARRRAGKKARRRLRKVDRGVEDGKLVASPPKPDSGEIYAESVERPTKLELATELLVKVACRFPGCRFIVVADHLYNGRNVLKGVTDQVSNVTIIARGRKDAALYDLPPRPTGRRGRPRKKGARLLNPEEWAEQNPDAFRLVTVNMYGRDVEVLVASYQGMAYRSLPGRLLRYIIVKDPQGIYRTDYFLCTDPDLDPARVLELYARRWPLERTFQECKQKLGLEDPEVQLPNSVRRCVPFTMFVYTFVVLWYLRHGEQAEEQMGRPSDPWYPKTARPSFTEMLACLRRLSWAEPFLDPASEERTRRKILADYLRRVVAAA